MQKVWILGDSYAEVIGHKEEHIWPKLLSKKYDVSNYALGGTGTDYMLIKLHELLHQYDIEYIKNVVLIIYMSDRSRINFSFLRKPSDSVWLFRICHSKKEDDSFLLKYSKYKSYHSFVKYFFKSYYFFNKYSIFMSYLGQYALLKEMSKLFKKILVIPVFHAPTLLNEQLTIDNTEKFTIGKGAPIVHHDDIGIDRIKPNHMRKENHNIVYNMTVEWIEKNIPFDTGKLIKIS